jgi:hypothetical protein
MFNKFFFYFSYDFSFSYNIFDIFKYFSETLRLNRLVTQTVLVGHYKPLDGNVSNDTERFRQRTLAVLPMNKPEICEIEVNVSKCVTDDIYEQVFLVRNVSHSNTEEIVDGSLYVDFAMTPGIKLISQEGISFSYLILASDQRFQHKKLQRFLLYTSN